jgi:hypothetical protein
MIKTAKYIKSLYFLESSPLALHCVGGGSICKPVMLEDCNVIILRKLSAFDFQNPYGFTNISFN